MSTRIFLLSLCCSALLACGASSVTSDGGSGGSGGAGGGAVGGGMGGAGGGATGGGTGGGATGGGGGTAAEVCDNRIDDDGDTFTDCADPDCFNHTACFASCVDLCTDGASICDANGVRACQLDTTLGCRVFAPAMACTNGLVCSGGACVATCSDQCTEGAKQCASTGAIVDCTRLASGCTDWKLGNNCPQGDVCSGGACVPRASCTNQCTQGATRCTTSGQVQTCVALSSGCTDWTFPTNCTTGQSCQMPGTACAPLPTCTQGQTRCSAQAPVVETCNGSGGWVATQNCPQACLNGACTASATCSAGSVRCNGTNVEFCNASGSAWLYSQTCNVGCTSGLCTGACTAGAKRCNAKTPELCNAGGTAWTAQQTCANDCYQGDCIQADLVIDGVQQVLEGDLKFANAVIVRNGGSLRVGPSGVLRLQAKTISVDGASNINANDLGTDTRGAGGPTTQSCTYGSCTLSRSVSVAASYGSAGQGASGGTISGYCGSPYYTTRSCTASARNAQPPYDRNDDLSISMGSPYTTNKGGGLVRLVAEQVTVDGQITANAISAGGSGGGIFIAADTITGAGAIQAAGGSSPTGGLGRVKLLRGATNSLSGTITGVQANSPMPPLDLVSGSHPDSNRWYNDGLGDLFIAWSKPYPSLNGYYYKTSTTEATLPSQTAGNGTFLQAESLVVPATTLVQGANWFHIVSVDSAFNVGNVKSSFKANISTAPPTIASASHPTQRAWTTNNALFFSWTNPQADANYDGYYYALDKFADSVPAQTAQNFTTNKQTLLANTPDGIWVFHLLNRDTRGAVTKVARHYTVYVGTEPAKENISGSAFDASNGSAPLSGVTISVNRGLFTTTTATPGTYTFGGNLYVGQWEVTASKAGYLSDTKMVTLAAGAPVNLNFTLSRAP